MNNNWLVLFTAGLFEVGFTTFLKLMGDFDFKHSHKILYFSGFLVCATLSFILLGRAMSTIPLGTAYAVWTGIGAFGTAIVGMVFFKDPITLSRVFFLFLLIASIVGLKLFSPN